MGSFVHPTAIVEEGVEVGDGTSIWDAVHVRGPSRIGSDCIIGEKTYIAYDVSIADLVKINAHVYVCAGVRIERGVMVSAGVVFTNDPFPRATDPDLTKLRPSEPDEDTLETTVCEGATIGAGAVIGPGIRIGRFAMVGMGSVVTRSVGDFRLVVGSPARPVGWVCRCGLPALRGEAAGILDLECDRCGRRYRVEGEGVEEI